MVLEMNFTKIQRNRSFQTCANSSTKKKKKNEEKYLNLFYNQKQIRAVTERKIIGQSQL